jgi:DNA-binding NtrC family response regulator
MISPAVVPQFEKTFPPLLVSPVRVLVISSHLEARQRVVRSLEALSLDVVACSNCLQAADVLAKQTFELVFCDESLPDGSYADLLHPVGGSGSSPRVVVITRNGDWDLYFEALSKGAFDVVRQQGYPTDLEMIVIRALREEGRAIPSHSW